ncbi:YlmC/YmxH family sporulation protein [Clostridium tagluense]|uniref:YlmC/YmxH family sporulation protein n=1 Tax=Clostridium tagluense TaxID=360422 RepID=UPI003556119F
MGGNKLDSLMFAINNLRQMEIIDLNSGSKMGYIKDLKVDCEDYRIISIILPTQKSSWFNKNNSIEIPWEKVKKIGVDVILVDGSDANIENE